MTEDSFTSKIYEDEEILEVEALDGVFDAETESATEPPTNIKFSKRKAEKKRNDEPRKLC